MESISEWAAGARNTRLGEANAGCQVALGRGSHLDQDATFVRFFAQSRSPEGVSSAFCEMLKRGETGWQRGEQREKRVPRGLNPGGSARSRALVALLLHVNRRVLATKFLEPVPMDRRGTSILF